MDGRLYGNGWQLFVYAGNGGMISKRPPRARELLRINYGVLPLDRSNAKNAYCVRQSIIGYVKIIHNGPPLLKKKQALIAFIAHNYQFGPV